MTSRVLFRWSATRRPRRSGQAATEYLILASLSVGIILGVLYPLIQERMNRIQGRLSEQVTSVVAQRQLGIPICWFFCESGVDQGDLDAAFGGAGGAAGGGADGASAGNTAGDEASGAGGQSGGGGSGGAGLSQRGRSGGAGAGGAGGGGAGDDANEDQAAGGRRSNQPAGGGSGGGAGPRGGGTTDGSAPTDEAAAQSAPDPSADATLSARRQGASRLDEDRAGGCAAFDLYTLFKILAIIALVILGVILFLSSRSVGRK